jgi:ABC-type maltose transport system permease subunit
VLVTNIFDEAIYRPLAKRFTKFEQHFQPKSYENSIIIKYFVYEYIITFADLFYIAFVRMDIIGLREQLLSLFFIDIIRRIVAELLIPKLKSKLRSYFVKTKESNSVEETALAAQAILEVNKEEY